MKNSILWKLSAAFAGCLSLTFSAMAAVPAGTLEGADRSSVYGWVWDSDNFNHIIPVEISFYPARSDQVLKTDIIKADDYQDKLQETIGDGYHGFMYSVDWNQFEQTELRVTAYAAEDERVFLGELTYNKETGACTLGGTVVTGQETGQDQNVPAEQGPGVPAEGEQIQQVEGPSADQGQAKESQNVSRQQPSAGQTEDASRRQASSNQTADASGHQSSDSRTGTSGQAPSASQSSDASRRSPSQEIGPGVPLPEPPKEEVEEKEPEYVSLGMFVTTGYCNCEICCPSGSSLTYSGTVPQVNRTISADISRFPIGTRLMINGIIYTVEDIGSDVKGDKIDIYYATHQEAYDHGVLQAEVFAVPEDYIPEDYIPQE